MPVTITKNNLPKMTDNAVRYMDFLIRREVFSMERDCKRSMKGVSTGVTYKTGKGSSHTASAPGHAPAIDTGFLWNSIMSEAKPMAMIAYLLVMAEYGVYLEYGTRKMAPRPFIAPAVEKCKVRIARTRIPDSALVNGPPQASFVSGS